MIEQGYTNSQKIALHELIENWKQYEKEGFSQVDRIKLLIHDAKNHYLLAGYALMSVQQWLVLEAVGHHYQEESEEKFLVFAGIIKLLAKPQDYVNEMITLTEEEIQDKLNLISKWNPPENRLIPNREWNNLWLKDFERPTK